MLIHHKTEVVSQIPNVVTSVIFVNENENENYQKRKNNDSVNEN